MLPIFPSFFSFGGWYVVILLFVFKANGWLSLNLKQTHIYMNNVHAIKDIINVYWRIHVRQDVIKTMASKANEKKNMYICI